MSTMRIMRAIQRRRYRCRGKIGETEILFNPSSVSRRLPPLIGRVRKRLLSSFRGLPSRKHPLSLGLKSIYFYAIRFKRTVADSFYYDREAFVNTLGGAKEVEFTLAHECAHAILHEITSAHIPQWLNEGLACLMSDRKFRLPARGGAFAMSLAQLGKKKRNFWNGPAKVGARYEISHFAVRYLADRWGLSRLVKILVALERHSVNKALQRHTGLTVKELDERIHEEILRYANPAAIVTTRSNSLSVVLQYEKRRHDAPYIWGRFSGEESRRLCRVAKRIGAPIAVMPHNARRLFVELKGYENHCIPYDFYKLVAGILCYIQRNPPGKRLS